MTDSWQDYRTALTGLTGLEERLAVRRREADAMLREEYSRAEQEKRLSLVRLDRTRLAVQTAAADLARVRLLLGVEVPLQDPVRPITTVGQAEAAAAAATQWADQAEATLASLRRTEQRLMHTPAPADTAPQLPIPDRPGHPRSRAVVIATVVLLSVVVLVIVGVAALVLR